MKKLIIFLMLCLPVVTMAQQTYTFTAYRNIVPNGYNFWLSVPDDYEQKKSEMPVVIFLHGHSLCGNDLYRVRRYGCLDAISMGRDIDALIIAPQNPGGPWKPERIYNVLQWTQEHFEMDTNRIYVIGMSLGGYGTFEFVGTYPEKIAAAMALCGGSNLKNHCGLNKVPLWILHGTADRDVPLSASQKIVNAMNECGPTDLLRFDKLPGINHSQPSKFFYLDDTYRWLFSHSLKDSPRQVNKDIKLTVADMGAAYQNINRNANKIVVVDSRANTGTETTTTATTSTSAKSSTPSNSSYHIVKKGDTLYAIAKRYHTTVSKLCQINHIREDGILSLGQKIKLR